MGTLLTWARRNVLPHCGRGSNLHHLPGCLSVLLGQESQRADATESASCARGVYHLPAFEQFDDPSRRPFPAQGKGWRVCAVVVPDAFSRSYISGRDGG